MSVRVFAPAKINLTLQVGRPRADRLHPLQSVVMFADVGDVVEAAPGEGLSLSTSGEFAHDITADENNLVLRAARALAQSAGIAAPGAALALEKNLPVASGIGGGSSDAAATLRALNQLWGLEFNTERLCDIARTLGADVPVCVAGVSAYMTGAGESFSALPIPEFAAVLVNPLKPLATAEVYRRFDAMQGGDAFAERPAPSFADQASALKAMAAIGNDLTAPARALLDDLTLVEAALRADPRVRHAGLSGSGATMFALVDDMETAEMLAEALQAGHPDWWVTETRLAGA